MSELPKPALPLRVGALLTVTPSIHVQVLAMADAIQIRAPFGNLSVPYAAITRVTKDLNGGIGLDLSGATVRLDCSRVPDMVLNALVELVERKRRASQA
jgi:hypothetical protein